MTFKDFNFTEPIVDALFYMGFENATPIQEQAIPPIQQGKDVLATAQTGTGKTAAFVLPVLNKLAEETSEHIDTLIIVPTRELALQIDQQIQGFSYFVEASSVAIYGGGDGAEFHEQRMAIKNGVNIIVATPGKLISHLNMGYVDLTHLQHFILDEADRMLDMGFYDDIKKIINYLPKKRQNMMFSATMPPNINILTKQMLVNPVEIKIAISKPAAGVKQLQYEVFDPQKNALIVDLISKRENYQSILIFTSTKKKVSEVVRALRSKIKDVEGISSDLIQKEREDVLMNFRSRQTKVLVATDVLSRGIDIKDINLVINYDVPADAEDYVHRIGRTARAETKGEAITLVNKDDSYKMIRIERLIEMSVPKEVLPEFLGESPDFSQSQSKGSGNRKGGGRNNSRNGKGNNERRNPRSQNGGEGRKPRPANKPKQAEETAENSQQQGQDTAAEPRAKRPANRPKNAAQKPRGENQENQPEGNTENGTEKRPNPRPKNQNRKPKGNSQGNQPDENTEKETERRPNPRPKNQNRKPKGERQENQSEGNTEKETKRRPNPRPKNPNHKPRGERQENQSDRNAEKGAEKKQNQKTRNPNRKPRGENVDNSPRKTYTNGKENKPNSRPNSNRESAKTQKSEPKKKGLWSRIKQSFGRK